MGVTDLIVKPFCIEALRRIAELWFPKSFTGCNGDVCGVLKRRRKVGFGHSCRCSIWREDMNGGRRAVLTDEGVDV